MSERKINPLSTIIFGRDVEEEIYEPSPEEAARMNADLKGQVDEVLSPLTDKERFVIRLRFGLDDGRSRTQVQVGQEIGRSRWTVGRIERRALQKLRHPSRSQALRDYLY